MTRLRALLVLLLTLALTLGGMGTATAATAATGSISGTVTDSAGHPLGGVPVDVTGGRYPTTTTTTSASDGTWTVGGLRADGYTVVFRPGLATLLQVQYAGGTADPTSAHLYAVGNGSKVRGVDAHLLLGSAVSGRVLDDAGAPVAGVAVDVRGDGVHTASAVTGTDGRYTAGVLPPASYTVGFTPSSPFVAQYYPGTTDLSSATSLVLTPGVTTPGIDDTLVRAGTITGRVTADGAPVAGDRVNVDGPDFAVTTTRADGTYTLDGLNPGTYTIAFQAVGQTYLGQYWDGKTESDATPVVVVAGATVTGIDAALQPAATIAGRVTGPTGAPLGGVVVGDELHGAVTAADGTYELEGVTAGSHRIRFTAPASTGLAPQYWRGAATPEQATPVVVAAGQHVTGIDARLTAGGSISGRVTDPRGAPVVGASVRADSDAGGSVKTETGSDGTYTVSALVPGSYTVAIQPANRVEAPEESLLSQYWGGSFDAGTAARLPVTAGSATSGIDAQLAAAGRISGQVLDGAGRPLAGGQLVQVVSTTGARTLSSSGSARISGDNLYTVGGLATGTYLVSFLSSSPTEYWKGSPDAAHATVVHVTAGATTPDISPRIGSTAFSDVPASSPYAGDIAWAVGRGLLQGYPDGTFRPTAPVTRLALAQALYADAGSPARPQPARATFRDVPLGSTGSSAVEWLAASASVPAGMTTFGPSAVVTVGQALLAGYTVAGSPAVTVPRTPTFADVPASSPFARAVEWAAAAGIVTGTTGTDGRQVLGVGAPLTRQDLARDLHRADGA